MNTTRKGLVAASSLAVLLALGACGQRDTTVGEATDTTTRTEQAAAETRAEVNQATADAGAATREAANDVNTAVMGAGSAAGGLIDDAGITTKINAGLAADKDLSAIRIDVDTKDGVVTLTGPVPSSTAKAPASEIAKAVKDVKSVNNQLTVSG